MTARSARCPWRYDRSRLLAPGSRFAPARQTIAWQWVPRSPSYRTRTIRQVNQ